jgi:transforming growth factor-beta-induced protein
MKRLVGISLVLVLGLLLAACGATGTPVEAPVVEVPAVEETMEEEAPGSIVDIAVADGRFNTLVAAVTAAGLADTLAGDGQFTVLAPTDDAFAALPAGTVEGLLEDPEGALRDILLYHVVDGAVPAETVVTLTEATTLQGEPISISVVDGEVILNDSVRVIITDIMASNGIIHVLDGVLLPPTIAAAGAEEMSDEAMGSIVDVAVADGRFNTLVAAVTAAGLADTLAGEGQFTVFAPTDDAFAALPAGTVEALLEDPEGALRDILLYHVVDGAVPAETVVTLDSATTLAGLPVAIKVEDGAVILNDTVQVVITDVMASNGIIHVIDGVLLPPAEEAMEESMGSIVDVAVADGRFNTLVAAVTAAGLADTLAGEGEFTVFAPTDDAFAALPEGTLESLLADPEGALRDILLYHVAEGVVPAATVVTLDEAPTLAGEAIAVTVDGDEVLLNDSAKVIITNVKASNGLIHVIDAVLLPPAMAAESAMADDAMAKGSIVDIAVADGRFNTLVAAVTAAGLADTLAGEGPFTVFAPTDDAFAALGSTVDALLEDPEGALRDILLYHVVDGKVMAADVVNLDAAPTLLGPEIAISIGANGDVHLNESVRIIITDVEADNGVIHVIDAVLLPPQ